MPLITWYDQAGESKVENGSVSVLARFLFVNHTKRRKLADLAAAPERGGNGQVLLRFKDQESCDVTFDSSDLNEQFHQDVLKAIGSGAKRALTGSSHQQGDGDAVLPAGWAVSVRSAIKKASMGNQQVFENPLSMDLGDRKLSDAVILLRETCAAWAESDLRRKAACAELSGAAESNRRDFKIAETHVRAAEIRALEAENECDRLLKSTEFLESEVLLWKSKASEIERALKRADSGGLLVRNKFLEKEINLLRERLLEVTGNSNTQGSSKKAKRSSLVSPETQHVEQSDTAKRIAELEVGPLRECAAEERDGLKRKLLLKWHPDKQPSARHSEIATRVMQELQNADGWENADGWY